MEFLPKPGQVKFVQIEIDPSRVGTSASSGCWGWLATAKTMVTAFCLCCSERSMLPRKGSGSHERIGTTLMEERGTRKDVPMKPRCTHSLRDC